MCRDNIDKINQALGIMFQCRTQHCVCRDFLSGSTVLGFSVFQCRTQHCVCRDVRLKLSRRWLSCFNAARSIVCVETKLAILSEVILQVSMPHAALCVSRQGHSGFKMIFSSFQCRTQHCVCRDAVSRSPCPARAEKAFWKDALFCAVFGVCG